MINLPFFARKPCGLPQGGMAFLASQGSAKMPRGLPRGASHDPEIIINIANSVAGKFLAVYGQGAPRIKLHPAHLFALYSFVRYIGTLDDYINHNIAALLISGPELAPEFNHQAIGGLATVYKILLGDYQAGKSGEGLVYKCVDELLRHHPRDRQGVFCHPTEPGEKIKVDYLLEVCPFLVMAGTVTHDAGLYEEAISQYMGMETALLDPAAGLFHHAKNWHGRDQLTPDHWARGTGCALAALTEILRFLPEAHPRRDDLLARYMRLLDRVIPLQTPRGLWRQELTDSASPEETSGSALILYALATGLAEIWLPDNYIPALELGWNGLVGKINLSGNDNIADTCIDTEPGNSPEYYQKRPLADNNPNAFGPIIMAAGAMYEFARAVCWEQTACLQHAFTRPDDTVVEKYFVGLHELCEAEYNGDGSWGKGTLAWDDDTFKIKNRESRTDHPLIRLAGSCVMGYLDAYQKVRDEKYLTRARAGLDWLVSQQEPDGSFRLYTRTREGQTNHSGCVFPTGIAASGLAKGYEYLNEQRYLDASERAADWEKTWPVTRNVNFNSFSVWHLAEHFRLTGKTEFLEAAIYKTKTGMLRYQCPHGGWPGHNSWIWYHAFNLRAYAALLCALPEHHPFRPILTRAARAAVKYLVNLQLVTGALYPNPDTKEASSAIGDVLQAAAMLYQTDKNPITLNLIYGLVRYRISPESGDPDLFINQEQATRRKGYASLNLHGLGTYLAMAK